MTPSSRRRLFFCGGRGRRNGLWSQHSLSSSGIFSVTSGDKQSQLSMAASHGAEKQSQLSMIASREEDSQIQLSMAASPEAGKQSQLSTAASPKISPQSIETNLGNENHQSSTATSSDIHLLSTTVISFTNDIPSPWTSTTVDNVRPSSRNPLKDYFSACFDCVKEDHVEATGYASQESIVRNVAVTNVVDNKDDALAGLGSGGVTSVVDQEFINEAGVRGGSVTSIADRESDVDQNASDGARSNGSTSDVDQKCDVRSDGSTSDVGQKCYMSDGVSGSTSDGTKYDTNADMRGEGGGGVASVVERERDPGTSLGGSGVNDGVLTTSMGKENTDSGTSYNIGLEID